MTRITRSIKNIVSKIVPGNVVQSPLAFNAHRFFQNQQFSTVIHGCGDRTLSAIKYLESEHGAAFINLTPGGAFDQGFTLACQLKLEEGEENSIIHLQHLDCAAAGAIMRGSVLLQEDPHMKNNFSDIEFGQSEEDTLRAMHEKSLKEMQRLKDEGSIPQNTKMLSYIVDPINNLLFKINEDETREIIDLSQQSIDSKQENSANIGR